MFTKKLQDFYTEVLGADLPHASSMMAMVIGGHEHPNASFIGELSGHNLFKESRYEYKGPNDFLHFTSVQSLLTILKQGFIRASEYRHLTDRNELAFASNIIDIDDKDSENEEIEHLKQTIFSISICEFNDTSLKDQFMWMQYANSAQGVSIRIKLHKPTHENYAMGRIIYGTDGLSTIRDIVNRAKAYKQTGRLFPRNFKELLLPILAFHKVGAFSVEKEIRLLFKHMKSPHEKHTNPFIYQDINTHNNLRYFNQIFLTEKQFTGDPSKADSFKLFKEHSLTLEITDIYFGRNVDPTDLLEFHEYFTTIKKQHGYNYSLWRLTNDNIILPTF